ncbi:DEAD/DEAH box helicase [Nocardia seriolae]|uniref:DEAD/DEAH box helicase n=1 Tax=Nocardia seriolae TaxID=37332 RepID=UPI00068DB44E|nr:DEAD/DEAH box helicase [Nocardia seriolae]MTJ61721.1 DNA helicase [Nocardia seriolae]MTJ76409.1 DNA helicase [Nocardia seriolae]MTJ86731.1 DNA helicase [Nocardia seriolae]MTK30726.1 DNA helicase [Nocardia seriolae]MTK39690.1 DNA helicase [Nocardia seriolae]
MIFAELYRAGRPLVIVERREGANDGAWARLQEAMSRGVVGGSTNRTDVRADVFLAELAAVREVRDLFGQTIKLGPALTDQLRSLAQDRQARERAFTEPISVDTDDLEAELRAAGFKRELKTFQLENLATVLRLPHGADFSVPGAGKTTVALANFALNRARGRVEQMLVVAPIAAFQAWKEDSAECLSPAPTIAIHTGAASLIPDDLDILLTNYNRVASDYDRIREHVTLRPTQVILDEAHRIKRGEQGVHGRAVLDLAYAARRRDVLTGTPAPQGAFDLIAPMRFLYPGQDQQILPASAYFERSGRDKDVLRETGAAISRYFVRTPKSRLDLPPTNFDVITEPMRPIQQAIYDALRGRYRGAFALDRDARRQFDRIGRVMMYLLEAATNPMLLVAGSDENDLEEFAHPPLELRGDEQLEHLLQRYRDHEIPWKYGKVADIVAAAANRNEKVIVWSTFVRNLRILASHLKDYQPAVVHGGVPPADGAAPGVLTRDAELDRFRNDPDCTVLLANPAACGEGVSLHHWCHHAVYIDRTFNAGHYLQSQDRIHRLGLRDGVLTRFTLLISAGTIDDLVDGRLREKIVALAQLMDDPGLVQVALPETDAGTSEPPVAVDDAAVITAYLQAADGNAT